MLTLTSNLTLSSLQVLQEMCLIQILFQRTLAKYLKSPAQCLVTSDPLKYRGGQPARPFCPWDSPGQNTAVSGLPYPPLGDLPNPGIKLRSPGVGADSLPSEAPGKYKNAGLGSLSLLQGIFPSQQSNWGLLHGRQILYQLSYYSA